MPGGVPRQQHTTAPGLGKDADASRRVTGEIYQHHGAVAEQIVARREGQHRRTVEVKLGNGTVPQGSTYPTGRCDLAEADPLVFDPVQVDR